MFLKSSLAAAASILLLFPLTLLAQTAVQSEGKIVVPDSFEGMAVQDPKGPYGDLAASYSYQNAGDRIEVAVYRPSYPSVSLWFEQSETRTRQLFSRVAITPSGASETFTAKSRNPNGMRRFFTLGAPFASTAIAVVGFGRWIVSVRSSSKTMDVGQQRIRLDQIVEAINVPSSMVESRYPVTPIADCIASKQMALGPLGESALDNVSLEMKVAGGLAAMIASKDAFAGNEGVAAQPSAYCRRQSASGKTVWFESVAAEGAQRWVMPISETGITVEGTSIPVPDVAGNFKMQGVVLTND